MAEEMPADWGAPIPGSRFLRDYCFRCFEPMRVKTCLDADGYRVYHWCEQCSPKHVRVGSVGDGSGPDPGFDNAVKIIEGD